MKKKLSQSSLLIGNNVFCCVGPASIWHYVPERLVGAGGQHGGPVGRQRQVQHARHVAAELGHARHHGVLPDHQLVVGVAVAGDQLLVVGAPSD